MSNPATSRRTLAGRLDRWYGKLLDILALLACILVGLMVVVICADVAMRAMRWGNLAWSPETAEYLLYLATFLAAPWLLREGQHIRMDMLLRAVPAKVAWGAELIMDLVGTVVCGVMTVACVRSVLASAKQGSLVIKILVIPEWWVLLPAAVLLLILTIEFLFRLRRLWLGPRGARQEATSAA
ncbi:TRAP transporter small permease [Pusillimonas sp.]|uniref:TRAP transporter small permease n=1 Tax=Pusillimonas sp. TaxID=3040095 RepID=UPI0029AF3D7D|nr:TRAP transporter small permease [Pusillimonas sp.]MDX3895558.1 TRAP transporter small permease [Pusillimonas sp.]